MTEQQKENWAGLFMAVFFVSIPLLGWLVLRLALRYI